MRVPTLRASLVGSVAVAALVLAGCGSSSSNATTTTTTSTTIASTTTTTIASTTTTTIATESGVTCPSATSLGAAAGVTYATPTSQAGAEAGWVVCSYNSQGTISLLLSLYPDGTPLSTVDANAAATPTPLSGFGSAASTFGTIVYVEQASAPSFSVIDESGNLTVTQTEAIASAVIAS
jgi:hypothetical protein